MTIEWLQGNNNNNKLVTFNCLRHLSLGTTVPTRLQMHLAKTDQPVHTC